METQDRGGIKKARVYKTQRILEAMRLKVFKTNNTYKVIGTEDAYDVILNKKTLKFHCTCHWATLRAIPDFMAWGYCKHSLAVLYRTDYEKFHKERQRTKWIQTNLKKK